MWSSAALQSAMAISRSTPTWLRCCRGDSGIAQEDEVHGFDDAAAQIGWANRSHVMIGEFSQCNPTGAAQMVCAGAFLISEIHATSRFKLRPYFGLALERA